MPCPEEVIGGIQGELSIQGTGGDKRQQVIEFDKSIMSQES